MRGVVAKIKVPLSKLQCNLFYELLVFRKDAHASLVAGEKLFNNKGDCLSLTVDILRGDHGQVA